MPLAPEYVAAVVIAVILALIKSAANGRLRSAWNGFKSKQSTASQAHARIPEVVDRLERIDEKQDRTYERVGEVDAAVERVGETVLLLHADDDHVDNEVLRDRLGVEETDRDLFTDEGSA